ncbi:MAG TPA: hypothetical protein VF221_06580 [Chloroflexota bacterium]
MKRAVFSLVALILLIALAVTSARAQTSVPGPNPPPSTVGPPSGGPMPPPGGPPKPTEPYLGAATLYPYDFQYHLQLYGNSFKPDERVTIAAEHVTMHPVVVTADDGGSFVATVDFTWVFCDPRATSSVAPAFTARGDTGTTSSFSLPSPPCPEITAHEHLQLPPPQLGGGVVSSGTAVAVGTAIAVPGGPMPPPEPPVAVTPQPIPTQTPRLVTFDLQAFGFVPGERVMLQERNSPGGTPAPFHAVADSQGRLEAAMQAYVPGFCSGAPMPPMVAATGDQGTAVEAPFSWIAPLIACPMMGAPGGDAKGLPSPDPPAMIQGLALGLGTSVVHPGKGQVLRIHLTGAGVARVTVRYPIHGVLRRTVRIGDGGQGQMRWTVPRGAHRGTAHVQVLVDPQELSLATIFQVR